MIRCAKWGFASIWRTVWAQVSGHLPSTRLKARFGARMLGKAWAQSGCPQRRFREAVLSQGAGLAEDRQTPEGASCPHL